tara:strand:+ start:867 stop:1028 length:162 start_codon:yes stop_codon:yes gene_type:complete
MKKITFSIMIILISFFGFSQSKEKKGIINSVEFSNAMEKNKIPASENAFLKPT